MRGEIVSSDVLVAAACVVDLVEPAREQEYRLPETRREALQLLNRLVVSCRLWAACGVVPQDGWAGAQRTAQDLLDFIFEGHAEHDPRTRADAPVEPRRAA